MTVASDKLHMLTTADEARVGDAGAPPFAIPADATGKAGPAILSPFVEFGPFRLHAGERLLLRMGQPILIGSRALDILILLTERAGDIVTKQQLIEHVWPDLTVEESSLRVHVAKLRKALDDGRGDARYIANIAGRGYSLVASVIRRELPQTGATEVSEPTYARELPRRLPHLIGRERDLRTVLKLIDERRFVTLHGAGGVGKTAVAVTLASRLEASFRDGVQFFDLGAQTASVSLPEILAHALGLTLPAGDPTSRILDHLRQKQMLLVFDCCEHVVDALAAFAERLFREAPEAALLATSREPLHAEGEYVYSLGSLPVPADASHEMQDIRSYPGAQLFLDRVFAAGQSVDLGPAEGQIVACICRRLDGIPLALEFAAACVRAHGLQGTAKLIESNQNLLWQGRRTAVPRHRTLHAMIGWSYDLLSEREKAVLRRLSVFPGRFEVDEATAVGGSQNDMAGEDIVEVLGQLIAKSLVVADVGERVRYRLLGTTRAYAWMRLVEADEADAVLRRHAGFYRDLFRYGAEPADDIAGLKAHAKEKLVNIRAALEWSFGKAGDEQLAAELAVGVARFLLDMSLFSECQRWAQLALTALGEDMRGTSREVELRLALAQALMFLQGNSEEVRRLFERALEIATSAGDCLCEFRVLCGMHIYYRRRGDLRQLLPIARRAELVAAHIADPVTIAAAHSMLGVSHHLTGNLSGALSSLTQSVRQPADHHGLSKQFSGADRDAAIFIPMTLWQMGFPDRASEAAKEAACLDELDPVTECVALISSARVFHLTGNWERVEWHVDRLIEHAGHYALEPYQAVAFGFKGSVMFQRGEISSGLNVIGKALTRLRAARYENYATWLSCMFADVLAACGHVEQALEEITKLIARQSSGVGNMPELLRVRADLLVQTGDLQGAHRSLKESVAIADMHGALSWRLRSAMSLVRLSSRFGSFEQAAKLLEESYGRFTEGFETADLVCARTLMSEQDVLPDHGSRPHAYIGSRGAPSDTMARTRRSVSYGA